MAEDLTKEEIPLPGTKARTTKKQYIKNWKLYATALGIVTIGLSVGLGVGLGTIEHHQNVLVAKKNLSDLGLKTTIDLSPDTTISDVNQLIDQFLQDNQDAASDLRNGKDIKINSYVLPDWGSSGWVEISGTGKYQGTLRINFPAWQQIALTTLDTTAINGVIGMTQDAAFNAFLANNQNIKDLAKNVDLLFIKPSYTMSGSLTIIAKANAKYTGNISITIDNIKGTDLSTLDDSIILGTENMKASDALAAFISNNQNLDLSDLAKNVDLSFIPPKYERTGLLTINVNKTGKYFGTIELVISRWGQKNIDELNLNTDSINGFENMSEADAWNAFMANNQDQDASDLRANVSLIITAPGYTKTGSLTIAATATGKYSGKVIIVINSLGQTNLNTLDLNLMITDSVTNQDDAFAAFLANNQTSNLSDYVQVGLFTLPTYNTAGKLVIIARTDIDNKYVGSVGVTINKIPQQNLVDLDLVASYNFDKAVKQSDIFDQFIKLNQEKYPDLKDNVEIGTITKNNNGGTLVIKAKTNGKYYGSVNFNFTGEMIKTDLNDLNLVTSLNDIFIVEDKAFEAFLSANSNIPDLRNSVEVTNFINSKYQKDGSLTISAKPDSEYQGSITISLGQIAIPLDLKKFDGYDAGDLEVTEDTISVIQAAIVNKIVDLAGPLPVDSGTIASAISIEINPSHTSALIKPQGIIGGIAVRNQATVYFTIKIK